MNRRSRLQVSLLGAAILATAFFLPYGLLPAEEEAEKTGEANQPFSYIGVKKCKTCHALAKYGAQYKTWKETRHAGALETLQTAKADSVAKARGMETSPHEAPECLKCHTTGHGAPAELRGPKLTLEEGISCEACHGAGSGYMKKSTMEKITAGEIEAASVGLRKPDAETCVGCHNEESPFYKEFDFDKFWAKIAHSKPKAQKDE